MIIDTEKLMQAVADGLSKRAEYIDREGYSNQSTVRQLTRLEIIHADAEKLVEDIEMLANTWLPEDPSLTTCKECGGLDNRHYLDCSVWKDLGLEVNKTRGPGKKSS